VTPEKSSAEPAVPLVSPILQNTNKKWVLGSRFLASLRGAKRRSNLDRLSVTGEIACAPGEAGAIQPVEDRRG